MKYGTLHTQGKAAYAQHNGPHITLHSNGKVTSWVERAKPKPVVKRVLVATATLADGASTAKVYKLTPNHYKADVFAGGTKVDALVAKGRAAYGQSNGVHVALQSDGNLTSWVDEDPPPTPEPDDSDQPDPVTPGAVQVG